MERETTQQIVVIAHYSDGSTEDVTRTTTFDSNDTEMAEVSVTGLVTTGQLTGSVAVMALAAGFPMPAAVALWLVFVARLIPSILYVRERLRLEKGKPHSPALPVAAHAVALLLVIALALNGLVPVIACGAMMILFYRAAIGLSARRTKMRAMQIGVWEVIYGATTVLLLVIGYYTGL